MTTTVAERKAVFSYADLATDFYARALLNTSTDDDAPVVQIGANPYTSPLNVAMGFQKDPNNSKTVAAADAQPGSPWVGSATVVESAGFVGVFLSAFTAAGVAIAGTYTFEFADNLSFTDSILISLHSSDFRTIRYRKLFEVGEYYRAKFEPDAPLGANTVIITSRLLRQPGPEFVVPVGHQFEEEEAAFATSQVFLKGFGNDGLSYDLRALTLTEDVLVTDRALLVRSAGQGVQPDGDYISQKATGTVWEFSGALSPGQTVSMPSYFDTDGWDGIEVIIRSNQVSASSGLQMKLTNDAEAITPDNIHSINRTYTASDAARGSQLFRLGTAGDGVKVEYTNGGIATASNFYIGVVLHDDIVELPQSGLDAELNDTNLAVMTRAVLNAKSDAGAYANLSSGPAGGLRVSLKEVESVIHVGKYDSVEGNAVNSVGSSSATQVATSPPSDAVAVMLQSDPDNGNVVIYVGTANTVSGSNAMYGLGTAGHVVFPVGSSQSLWVRASTGSGKTLRWTWLRRATP